MWNYTYPEKKLKVGLLQAMLIKSSDLTLFSVFLYLPRSFIHKICSISDKYLKKITRKIKKKVLTRGCYFHFTLSEILVLVMK